MSGAHKVTLRIYGARGSWLDDVVIYATDEGKARLIALLAEAELSPSRMIHGAAVDVLAENPA